MLFTFWTWCKRGGGGGHGVQKEKFYYLLKIRFWTFLTKINHFCPFFVHFCPILFIFFNFFFSKKCNFRPYKTIFDRNLPFFAILRQLAGKQTVYLPTGDSGIFEPSVNYDFLGLVAALLGQIGLFCTRRKGLLVQKSPIWPRHAAPQPKKNHSRPRV